MDSRLSSGNSYPKTEIDQMGYALRACHLAAVACSGLLRRPAIRYGGLLALPRNAPMPRPVTGRARCPAPPPGGVWSDHPSEHRALPVRARGAGASEEPLHRTGPCKTINGRGSLAPAHRTSLPAGRQGHGSRPMFASPIWSIVFISVVGSLDQLGFVVILKYDEFIYIYT